MSAFLLLIHWDLHFFLEKKNDNFCRATIFADDWYPHFNPDSEAVS
jgi:hypothetical protein